MNTPEDAPGAETPANAASLEPPTLADQLPHGQRRDRGNRNLAMLAMGALGIVYGDVGTSPIYTLRETFGHTGFTGTCVWVDPASHLVYIFLSNRVTPTRNNNKLSSLSVRSNIQEAIYQSIAK